MSRLISEDATKHRFAGLRQGQQNNRNPSAAKRYFLASVLISRDIHVMVPNDEQEAIVSITIELPPEIEQVAKAKAEARGVSLEEYPLHLVARVLQQEEWEKDEA